MAKSSMRTVRSARGRSTPASRPSSPRACAGVITDGTGRVADIGRPAAGTTGATDDSRDAWFVGYTPDLVAAVWVGYPDGQAAMDDVHGAVVTGGTLPAEIWARFMTAALADYPRLRLFHLVRGPLMGHRRCL